MDNPCAIINRMGHIHTEEGQHDHTVGAYIIREDEGEPKLILHMHKKMEILLQFGGHVELNETPWQAVVHEVREESGYDIDQLNVLQPKERIKKLTGTVSDVAGKTEHLTGAVLHPYPVVLDTHIIKPGHYHSNDSFACVTDQKPKQSVDEGESTDMRLLTRDEVAQLSDEQIPPSVRETALFIFDVCLPNWERVDTSEFKS